MCTSPRRRITSVAFACHRLRVCTPMLACILPVSTRARRHRTAAYESTMWRFRRCQDVHCCLTRVCVLTNVRVSKPQNHVRGFCMSYFTRVYTQACIYTACKHMSKLTPPTHSSVACRGCAGSQQAAYCVLNLQPMPAGCARVLPRLFLGSPRRYVA